MREAGDFSPYRPLEFDVRGSFCNEDACQVHPDLANVALTVEKVQGTAETVAVGERYVVSGRYTLAGDTPYSLSLAVTKAFGSTAYLSPGEGRFSISTEILEFADRHVNGLGVIVGNERTGKMDIVRWVMLKP